MEQKIQTLIMYPNGDIAKRMDDFLYQPASTIIIKDTEYHRYTMYDVFDCEDYLIRKIWLKE